MAAVAPILTTDGLFFCKLEGTAGTFEDMAAADACRTVSVERADGIAILDKEQVNGSTSPGKSTIGEKITSWTIICHNKGSGTAGTAPEFGPMMQASGRKETLVGATSATYTPVPEKKTVSCQLEVGGRVYKLEGGAGSMALDPITGLLTFTIQGKFIAMTEASATADPVFDSTEVVTTGGVSFTFNSIACILRSIELQDGAQVAKRGNWNDATGVQAFVVSSHVPVGTLKVEDMPIATLNLETEVTGAEQRAWTLTRGATAGNICTISGSKMQLTGFAPENDGGVAVVNCPFKLQDSAAGAQDFSTIAYT